MKGKKPPMTGSLGKECNGKDYCECEVIGSEDDGFYGHMGINKPKTRQKKIKYPRSF